MFGTIRTSLTSTIIYVFSATFLLSAECVNDPSECTPKRLCEVSTEIQQGQKVWSSKPELNAHINFAKDLGIDCGASDPKSLCDLDANECTVIELCDKATVDINGQTTWSVEATAHVNLAKDYGLECGVVTPAKTNTGRLATCSKDVTSCPDEQVCDQATIGSTTLRWHTKTNLFVAEAERRGLTCGVSEYAARLTETVCSATEPQNCASDQICSLATTPTFSGRQWVTYKSSYVEEAKKRGLTCGVDTKPHPKQKNVCLNTAPQNCSEEILCQLSTREYNDGTIKWLNDNSSYVREAKKRGLTCGVTTEPEVSQQNYCTSTEPQYCDEEILCELAAFVRNGDIIGWKGSAPSYVEEAKRRGLTCGITPSMTALQSSERVCGGRGYWHQCTGEYTHENGDKVIGRWLDGQIYGVGTVLFERKEEYKGNILVGRFDNTTGRVSGQQLYVWRSGHARYDLEAPQGSFKSNSTVDRVFPELRRTFHALPKQQRLKIQRSLSNKELYAASLDGAWGRNTLIGLARFSAEHLDTVNLKSQLNVDLVLDGVIAQTSLSRTKMASLSVLEDVAKRDAAYAETMADSSTMRNAFVNEKTLRRKQIQYALKKLGYYASGIDGVWGQGTSNALAEFALEGALEDGDPGLVFSELLSRVSVPTSFSVAKSKVTNNKKTNSKPQSSNGLIAIISNPQMSAAQALAICEPLADLAYDRASNSYKVDYDDEINCSGYGNRVKCTSSSDDGGFWGGFYEGLGSGMEGRKAKKATLKSCLAEYGWKKP